VIQKQELIQTRELLMDQVGKDLPNTYYQREGRLGKYLWSWKKIGGLSCVGYDITANYTDKRKASITGRVTKNGTNIMARQRCKQNTTK
jgi:hypothetical protein